MLFPAYSWKQLTKHTASFSNKWWPRTDQFQPYGSIPTDAAMSWGRGGGEHSTSWLFPYRRDKHLDGCWMDARNDAAGRYILAVVAAVTDILKHHHFSKSYRQTRHLSIFAQKYRLEPTTPSLHETLPSKKNGSKWELDIYSKNISQIANQCGTLYPRQNEKQKNIACI